MALPNSKRVIAPADAPAWAGKMATDVTGAMGEQKTAIDKALAALDAKIAALQLTIADHENRLVTGGL